MRWKNIVTRISTVRLYRMKLVLSIAIVWTVVDVVNFFTTLNISLSRSVIYNAVYSNLLIRELIIFMMSALIGYVLVFVIRDKFRQKSMWKILLIKSFILISAAVLMTFIIYLTYAIFSSKVEFSNALSSYWNAAVHSYFVLQKLPHWLFLLIITQILIEVHDKYAPGVFADILLGKYLIPKVEKRIVMFIDLKDSTPIAEKLGNIQYFKFIREFIYQVSNALIDHGGIIYQYVGDEVVVSWRFSPENTKKCMAALIQVRKNLHKQSDYFRRQFDIVPEFRVGIHVGEVTVGEIGVIKKDLAMSGDTMNTTARIRTACSELNQKFIVSKDFVDELDLKDWQSENLGEVELKGKNHSIELFALKI